MLLAELEHSGKMTSKFLIFSSDGTHFQRVNLKNQGTNKQKTLIICLGETFVSSSNHAVPRQCGAAGSGRGRVLRRLGAKLHRATEGCGAGHGQCAVVGDGPSAGWETTKKC